MRIKLICIAATILLLSSCSDESIQDQNDSNSTDNMTTSVGWPGSQCDILDDVGIVTEKANSLVLDIEPDMLCLAGPVVIGDGTGTDSVSLSIYGSAAFTTKIQISLTSVGMRERPFSDYLEYVETLLRRLGFHEPDKILAKIMEKRDSEEVLAITGEQNLAIRLKMENINDRSGRPFRHTLEIEMLKI